jgi:glycosyltransferase involved in cell wall biosynthesis
MALNNHSNKINLVIELSSFDKGGLEKVVLDSALMLSRERFNITVVSIGKVGLLGQIAEKSGIDVIELNQDDKLIQYENILIAKKIDIALSHFSRFGYQLFRKLRIKNITYIHNVYAFLAGEALQNFVNDDRYVDRYISVSPNATKYAISKIGLAKSKIVTVPNGLLLSDHSRRLESVQRLKRSLFDLKDDDYVFLNVASYNLHKGHYLMADAMSMLLKKRSDIKILCIGNVIHQAHIDQFRKYLVSEGLSHHILMPGHFENIEAFHQMTNAFLLPSFIEGWSIAMNEAMFYQKPMILTNTGGASEVISNSDIGVIVENEFGDILNLDSTHLDELGYNTRKFKTSEKLASVMAEFADNREIWEERGKVGRDKILARYNMQDVADQYSFVIESIFSSLHA